MAGSVVKHWWNGRWGRLTRRDVYVRTHGKRYELELREGGSEGTSWRRLFDTLDDAVGEAGKHMSPDMTWSDITDAHRTER